MVNISDLLSKYNPPPHLTKRFDTHSNIGKPPVHPNLPTKIIYEHQTQPIKKSQRQQIPKKSRKQPNSSIHHTSQQSMSRPLQLEKYIKTLQVQHKVTDKPLLQRKTITFGGKRQRKDERRKNVRVEKHVKCANTKVLRKFLHKKDIRTSKKTPPQLLNTLSKLLIGSRITIHK